METEAELNLYDIPLMALRASTRQIIANELNKKKVLASDEGLPRDWRGLAHLTGLPAPSGDNPANQLITVWERDSSASVGLLEQFLGQLDRWDIVDDVKHSIRVDAKDFSSRMTENSPNKLESVTESDPRTLTFDDIVRLEHGLDLQVYDALLLYADQDEHFAKQMLDRLENDYRLKLCLKENLVGGLSFEHQGVLRLISERCRRVIIIVSRSFIDSPVNQFFVTFSQALAIEQRRRIIIPCMYEREHINLPIEIKYLHKLDYNRVGLRNYNFWELLWASVTSTPALPAARNSTVTIREISNSTREQLPDPQKAIRPAAESLPELTPTTSSGNKQMKSNSSQLMKSSTSELSLSENLCSTSLLNVPSTPKISSSLLNLQENNPQCKCSKEFFRKLFPKACKHTKKTKKIAVRL